MHVFLITIFATLFASTGASATNQEPGMVSVPLNVTCPTGQSPCCQDPQGDPPCNGYGFTCYDPKTQSCCNAYQDDCWSNVICNISTDFCALPNYGCEYSGQPTCCPRLDGYGRQCAGRHAVSCFDNRTETCCYADGWPAVCKLDEVCCKAKYPGPSWCCPSGSQCGPNYYGCVNHTQH